MGARAGTGVTDGGSSEKRTRPFAGVAAGADALSPLTLLGPFVLGPFGLAVLTVRREPAVGTLLFGAAPLDGVDAERMCLAAAFAAVATAGATAMLAFALS